MDVNSGSSPPTKKRKDNDDRADVHEAYHHDAGACGSDFLPLSGRGEHESFGTSHAGNNMSQLDRMEQMMMRMEEKLATVSSRCLELEAKCSSLEAKCSSLESKLESTAQSMTDHVDKKFERLEMEKLNDFNAMLAKNQSWEYSAVLHPKSWYDYLDDDEAASSLVDYAEQLRKDTIQMRRGEFPFYEVGGSGIYLATDDQELSHYIYDNLLPHLKEFIAAIKQFTPAMNLLPKNKESFFVFSNLKLGNDTKMLLKEALIGKPFTRMSFLHNPSVDYDDGGMSMDVIIDIVESNKHLRKLQIRNNTIRREHIERLCSVVHNQPLVELDLTNCFDAKRGNADLGNVMLTSLLTSGELSLLSLNMEFNNITSDVSVLLADFIATNPRLKELDLSGNELNDSDAALIATALRSNTTLKGLQLSFNNITESGFEKFLQVLFDKSSLNAAADSNHFCSTSFEGPRELSMNRYEEMGQNRGWKIYFLLAVRHETMSNVKHFSDIDVKILPNVLEAVQKYAKTRELTGLFAIKVASISVVYEIMRKWEVVFNLYESLGGGEN